MNSTATRATGRFRLGSLDRHGHIIEPAHLMTALGEIERIFASAAADIQHRGTKLPSGFQLDDRRLGSADVPRRLAFVKLLTNVVASIGAIYP